MTEIIEVFWNARPHLSRLKIKVGGGPLHPVADRLFSDVREGVAARFPGKATLVRIATRGAEDKPVLKIVRNGEPECREVHLSVEAMIDKSVDAAARAREAI